MTGTTAYAICPPNDARGIGCGYALRDLRTPRCPECGREFDPADTDTMFLPGRPGRIAQRLLKPPGWILYAWPIIAAAALFVGARVTPGFVIGYWINADVHLPVWTGVFAKSIPIWNNAIWCWFWLLVAWIIRASIRRVLVMRHDLPRDVLKRDRPARRFACACFLAVILLADWRADRCNHGEYWGSWIGLVHNYLGMDWCAYHYALNIPVGGRWSIYVQLPRI